MLLDENEEVSKEPRSWEKWERQKKEGVDKDFLEVIDMSFALTIDVHLIISR